MKRVEWRKKKSCQDRSSHYKKEEKKQRKNYNRRTLLKYDVRSGVDPCLPPCFDAAWSGIMDEPRWCCLGAASGAGGGEVGAAAAGIAGVGNATSAGLISVC